MPKVEVPLLLNIPQMFETERLLCRGPRAGDGAVVYQAIQESLPELKPWMRWAFNPPDADTVEANLRREAGRFILREKFEFLVFRKADDAFVASVSLHSIQWTVPLLEIGYWGRSSMGGHGYVTEAVRGLTDFVFTYMRGVHKP